MTKFEKAIKPYKYIWATYENAISIAKGMGLKDDAMDFFVSKNCRAWFFLNHLKVEREGSDQEQRDVSRSAIVPFELSGIQLTLLDKFEARMFRKLKFRQRIMKCRRAKVSTIYLAICYHIVRFGENKKGLCFADRLETSRRLRRILDIFYQTDDLICKPEIGKKTLCEGLYLHPPDSPKGNTDRDSFILLGSGEQSNTGIGGSLDFMHWSEASLTKDGETHWTTISPSLQGALFDIAESTPSLTGQDSIIFPEFEHPSEGCDTHFISWLDVAEYRIDSETKVKEFSPYIDHNLYGKEAEIIAEFGAAPHQMLWRRFKLDELKSLNSFRQMFPISTEEAFYSSAGIFFHKDLIALTKTKDKIEPRSHAFSDQGGSVSAIPDAAGMWKLYENVDMGSSYIVTCDTAEGKCSDKEMRDPDYSVAVVWKMGRPIREVAFFRDRVPPEIFAEQIAACARYYNNCLVVPERNGPGLAMIIRLLQIHNNVYRHQRLQAGAFVMTQDYGFQTTSTSKVQALSSLLSQIRDADKGMIIHTDIIHLEMSKFVQTGVKYGSMNGFHDDTVTCLWLAAICVSQTPSLLEIRSDFLDGQSSGFMGHTQNKVIERDEWAYSS